MEFTAHNKHQSRISFFATGYPILVGAWTRSYRVLCGGIEDNLSI